MYVLASSRSVHMGQQVDVKVPSLNRSFPGKVRRFAEKLHLSTRTMETEVDVPNASLLLIPGMYAEVDLTMEQKVSALAVPVTAVDRASDEGAVGDSHTATVMLVGPQQRLEARRVTLRIETTDSIAVLSRQAEEELLGICHPSTF